MSSGLVSVFRMRRIRSVKLSLSRFTHSPFNEKRVQAGAARIAAPLGLQAAGKAAAPRRPAPRERWMTPPASSSPPPTSARPSMGR